MPDALSLSLSLVRLRELLTPSFCLASRIHGIAVNNQISYPLLKKCGVSQGFVIEPLLLSVCIHNHPLMQKFGDDTAKYPKYSTKEF